MKKSSYKPEKEKENNSDTNNIIESNSKVNNSSDKIKNKMEIYSDLGYINVDKAEYEDSNKDMIFFEKKNNKMEGRLSKSTLSEKITVNLKTLYGNRKVYSLTVFIKNKISILIDKLVEEEIITGEKQKWNPKYQYRLISTNGLIKELNPIMSFADEEIKNNYTIILASPYKTFFSEIMKHEGIFVSFMFLIKYSWKILIQLHIINQEMKIIY